MDEAQECLGIFFSLDVLFYHIENLGNHGLLMESFIRIINLDLSVGRVFSEAAADPNLDFAVLSKSYHLVVYYRWPIELIGCLIPYQGVQKYKEPLRMAKLSQLRQSKWNSLSFYSEVVLPLAKVSGWLFLNLINFHQVMVLPSPIVVDFKSSKQRNRRIPRDDVFLSDVPGVGVSD